MEKTKLRATSPNSKRVMIIPHEYKLTSEGMEHPSGKSLTVLDDSYTIRELLEKYTRGVDLSLMRQGSYNLDEDAEDYDHLDLEKVGDLDLSEKSELLQEARDKVSRQWELLKGQKKAKPQKPYEANEDDLSPRNEDEGRSRRKGDKPSEGKGTSQT